MQRLRFISPMAHITEVVVDAVNDGHPLVHGEIYTVSNELADQLEKNEGDWKRLSPPKDGDAQAEANGDLKIAGTPFRRGETITGTADEIKAAIQKHQADEAAKTEVGNG